MLKDVKKVWAYPWVETPITPDEPDAGDRVKAALANLLID
jgi:hypothetical protein